MIAASTWDEITFVCRELQYRPTSEVRGITYHVDGAPRMIVLFDCWTENAVTMHQWCEAPRYFSRKMIREAFRYAFEIADKEVAIGIVRSDNETAMRLDKGLGFTEAAVIKDAHGPGIDMHILQLRRGECRWYKPHGN